MWKAVMQRYQQQIDDRGIQADVDNEQYRAGILHSDRECCEESF